MCASGTPRQVAPATAVSGWSEGCGAEDMRGGGEEDMRGGGEEHEGAPPPAFSSIPEWAEDEMVD